MNWARPICMILSNHIFFKIGFNITNYDLWSTTCSKANTTSARQSDDAILNMGPDWTNAYYDFISFLKLIFLHNVKKSTPKLQNIIKFFSAAHENM